MFGSAHKIIPLGTRHQSRVEQILLSDPVHHIHQIYELERFGLGEDRQNFWGIRTNNDIQGILFSDGFHMGGTGFVTSRTKEECAALVQFGFSKGLNAIIGSEDTIAPILNTTATRGKAVKRWRVYQCHSEHLIPRYDYPVRQASIKDVDALTALYSRYEYRAHDDVEKIKEEILGNFKSGNNYFVVADQDRIIAGAMLYMETSYAAVIGAARVLPEYRGKGVYYSLRTACFEYLFGKKKYAVGFFVEDNTAMANVVRKNGGKDAGHWLVLRFSTEKTGLRHYARRLVSRIRRTSGITSRKQTTSEA